MGRFKKSVFSVNASVAWRITISDDYVDWGFSHSKKGEHRRGCAFLDTKSMKITKIPLVVEEYHVLEEMDVRWPDRTSTVVEVGDPKNNWIINVGNAEESK